MAVRYYDDAIIDKLKRWIPDNSRLRVLKPDESRRFFELTAEDRNDAAFTLPMVALSRNKDIELLNGIKSPKSYDGLILDGNKDISKKLNVIPIKVEYQLDIYTKTYEEGDEYIRNFLFKLLNNPTLYIDIPYNNSDIKHIANIRLLGTISDTSDISEHLFAGQFTRWTISFELQDAFLFSIPYKNNWKFGGVEIEMSKDETEYVCNCGQEMKEDNLNSSTNITSDQATIKEKSII